MRRDHMQDQYEARSKEGGRRCGSPRAEALDLGRLGTDPKV